MLSFGEFVSSIAALIIMLWLLYFYLFRRVQLNPYDKKLIRRVISFYMGLTTVFFLVAIFGGCYQ